ncbi:hypothetical protein D3C81_456990 [compost metagenome]
MPATANTLPGECKADTIAEMCHLSDAACLLAEDDEVAHPGLRAVILEIQRRAYRLQGEEKNSTR